MRFVALFVLFSILLGVNVNAASILDLDDDDLQGNLKIALVNSIEYNGQWIGNGSTGDVVYAYPLEKSFYQTLYPFNYSSIFNQYFEIYLSDGSYVLNKDSTLTFNVTNILSTINVYEGSNKLFSRVPLVDKFSSVSFYGFTSSGDSYLLNSNFKLTSTSSGYSLTFDLTGDRDYVRIQVMSRGRLSEIYNLTQEYFSGQYSLSLNYGFNRSRVTFSVKDSTEGLLGSIIGWLTSIRDNIVNGLSAVVTAVFELPYNIADAIKGFFDNVVNAVNKVFTAISQLPAELWYHFENGLKILTVPTEEQVSDFNDKMNNLLSDRFGALYEVGDLCVQHIEAFQQYYEVGTINFPATTVDLAGSPFTFGGWTVDICPDGFEFLFDALKLAIDMVCTLAVINGLKHRFDRLLGVR